MIVQIPNGFLTSLGAKSAAISKLTKYASDAKRHRVDLRMFSEAELARLEKRAGLDKPYGYRQILVAIRTFRMMATSTAEVPVSTINGLHTQLTALIEPTPNRWVFEACGTHLLPYYVTSIEYEAPQAGRYPVPEHVVMTINYAATSSDRGTKTVRWFTGDLDGTMTPSELLRAKNLYVSDSAKVEAYMKEITVYQRVTAQVGTQFLASGVARTTTENWWQPYQEVAMERDGERARVVVDEDDTDEDGRLRKKAASVITGKFWVEVAGMARAADTADNDDEETGDVVELPVHPYVSVFDLKRHEALSIHASDLEPYEYDSTLIDKLVIPSDTMFVVRALIANASNVKEDVIRGKTGGTVVISTGPPGTGKTLTAEVMAEVVKRPLYEVQCAQLGITIDQLEQRLNVILTRATRWGAILVVNEADVYIRKRGGDIAQNAVVGVWLRLLEYYRGILFLTSNRSTIIDDAILQRATAWIRYDVPTAEAQCGIWRILAHQYGVTLSDDLIGQLHRRWPSATGRNIKAILKLSDALSHSTDAPKGFELFEMAARFLDINPHNRESDE